MLSPVSIPSIHVYSALSALTPRPFRVVGTTNWCSITLCPTAVLHAAGRQGAVTNNTYCGMIDLQYIITLPIWRPRNDSFVNPIFIPNLRLLTEPPFISMTRVNTAPPSSVGNADSYGDDQLAE
jgi:hypothetical protein